MSLGLASRPELFTVSIWSARLMFAFLHSLKIRFKWAWVYTAEVNGSMCSCTAGACPNMGMLATAAAPHMEEKQLWYQHSFFCHSDFTRTFRFHYSYWRKHRNSKYYYLSNLKESKWDEYESALPLYFVPFVWWVWCKFGWIFNAIPMLRVHIGKQNMTKMVKFLQ